MMTVLHVATAVFIVGPMAILPMTGLRSLRSGNAAQVRTLARSTGIFTWLSLLTFVFGFGVMGMADPKFNLSFTTPWILWSIILYAIAFLLTIFVVVPRMTAAAEGAAEGAKPANYGIIAATSGLSALLLLAVVVLMIWKP